MQTQIELIAHLPGDILLALARNESAAREMRKAAVKLMMENEFFQYKHAELVSFVDEIKRETEAKDEVEAIVETAIESEISPTMVAGFTTANMMQTDLIRNPEKLGEDAL